MKQKSCKKTKAAIFAMLLAMSVLGVSGCGWARDLSPEFEEEKVITAAEGVVEALNDCDFEAIEDMVAEEFQDEINADMLEESLGETMQSLGAFKSYDDKAAVGLEDENYDGEIAVAVMNASYENGLLTVTISYNTDYEIIGFYAR